jgi:cation transport regulator ChaC
MEPVSPGYVSIFGYGNLMDLASALRTVPSAKNLRKARLDGYTRMYNLVSVGGIKSGIANQDTKEMAALSIVKKYGAFVLGCVFEIDASEVENYLYREHRYKVCEVDVFDFQNDKLIPATTVISQSDEEYYLKLPKESPEYEEMVGRYYTGSLWGRKDILPMKSYMMNCIIAAYRLGSKEWLDNMLDGTLLADTSTSLRVYAARLRDQGELDRIEAEGENLLNLI